MTVADTVAVIFDAVESHALTLGLFERVNFHEPSNAPGTGLSTAIWVQNVGPVPTDSGLAATTGRLELNIRLYGNMAVEPRDAIDPSVLGAALILIGDYSGDFDLGGNVRNVDLLGAAGAPLSGAAGYLELEPGALYRVFTIVLPLIINDLWTQSP